MGYNILINKECECDIVLKTDNASTQLSTGNMQLLTQILTQIIDYKSMIYSQLGYNSLYLTGPVLTQSLTQLHSNPKFYLFTQFSRVIPGRFSKCLIFSVTITNLLSMAVAPIRISASSTIFPIFLRCALHFANTFSELLMGIILMSSSTLSTKAVFFAGSELHSAPRY